MVEDAGTGRRGHIRIEHFVTDPIAYPNWDCIDTVMHQDAEGNPHIYSSKPPLLATLYAGPYWVVYKIGGHSRHAGDTGDESV